MNVILLGSAILEPIFNGLLLGGFVDTFSSFEFLELSVSDIFDLID